MAENPILFALQGLGTSISNISTAEAQRRRDALAAQGQENEQRRALEVLRLSGEQQMARLGIEEAKTRYEIQRGEAGERRAETKAQQEAQLFVPQLEAARLAPRQAEAGIKQTEAVTQKTLADIELDKLKQQDLANLHAAQRGLLAEQTQGARTERQARESLPSISMATYESAIQASPNLSTPRKALMLHFLESMRQKNQLTFSTPMRVDIAGSVLKTLNDYADIVEGGDEKLIRGTAQVVVGEMAKAGTFKTGAEAAQAVQDFTRLMTDPAAAAELQQNAAELKRIEQSIYAKAKEDPAKVPLKRREAVEQEAVRQHAAVLRARAAPATPPPPGLPTEAPAVPAQEGAPGVPSPITTYGPSGALQRTLRAAEAVGDVIGQPATGPLGALSNLFGERPPPAPVPQEEARARQFLQTEMARLFPDGRIPDGSHVVNLPLTSQERLDRIAVRVRNGQVEAFEIIASPKPRGR